MKLEIKFEAIASGTSHRGGNWVNLITKTDADKIVSMILYVSKKEYNQYLSPGEGKIITLVLDDGKPDANTQGEVYPNFPG